MAASSSRRRGRIALKALSRTGRRPMKGATAPPSSRSRKIATVRLDLIALYLIGKSLGTKDTV